MGKEETGVNHANFLGLEEVCFPHVGKGLLVSVLSPRGKSEWLEKRESRKFLIGGDVCECVKCRWNRLACNEGFVYLEEDEVAHKFSEVRKIND